ncbi:unnamed protein product [Hydatigera taeniaeformis]|uniref:Fibrous sheath-interacting protein 1 n=1 Tax=Hydatigena taeniaeformis TaxID=6205 RepID=A0A0R3X2V5_HYDTA|nr:unnamed protein product [Hydatigera taeniaeformis]
MIPSSGDTCLATMAVYRPGYLLLGGDTPQSPLKLQALDSHDSVYLKSSHLTQRKEQALFNHSLVKSNGSDISVRSIKPAIPSANSRQVKKKPAILFHSRRIQQEAEVCPFIPLIQNLPVVEQEVIVIEDKTTHTGGKTASEQHVEAVGTAIRSVSQKSSTSNCLEKRIFDHYQRREGSVCDPMTKTSLLKDQVRSKGCRAIQVSTSSSGSGWVCDLNTTCRTPENTIRSGHYHECTVIDNKDTDTVVPEQDISSELSLQSHQKHCQHCDWGCRASESADTQPPSITYVSQKKEFAKTSCTVDLINADLNFANGKVQEAPAGEILASEESPVGLSEAFMNALLRVHEKPFLDGILGRIEQIRFH